MRKLFLLISILTLSIVANAATINITPTSYSSTPLNQAVDAANANDTIVLSAGTYVETSGSGYINFNKNVVIKAADEAEVIIDLRVPMTIQNGARAEIIGLKFDATHLYQASWYTHIIYADDASENNRLIFEGCEFYNDTIVDSAIYCASNKKLDSCVVNNCKFHDIARSCMFFENTDMLGVSVTNSTFYNITNPRNYYSAGVIDLRGASTKLRVDHCTFYNVQVINTDYAAIGNNKVTISDGIVSNCIFAMPSSTNNLRAIRNVTTANNCLVYNYEYDSNWGIHSTVTKNSCIQLKDPLFNDLANNKFTYDGDWTTMSISPARYAGTDGSDLGDPRWYTAETLPSTNFASAYDLLGTKALLSGRIGLNGSNHIAYNHNSEIADGTAKWKLHVSRSCYISVVADREAGNSVGCQLTLTVKDADGNIVGLPLNAAASYNDNDISFPGTIFFSEEGDYTLILTNSTLNSTAVLEKITLSYYGGAVQDISTSTSTTLNVADAWFSTGGTRADGKIDFPNGSIQDGWIRWNVNVPETKYFDITVNIASSNGHNYGVRIFNDDRSIALSEGGQTSDASPRELGRVNIPSGDYTVEVTNSIQHSDAELISVLFTPVVATSTALPNTLDFSNAVLSEKANITDGMLYFNEPGADKDPRGEWAQWEVTTDHDDLFLFTMGVTSSNGQNYKITIKDDGDNVLDYHEASFDSGDKTIKHYFALNTGTYFVKVENTRSYSKGHLTNLVVTEPAGVITLSEADTNTDAWSDKVVDKDAEGPLYDVQIIRTIKAGMYNTICLPFEVTSAQAKEIFGSDVQLRTLESATIEEGDFVLNLNFTSTSSMYQGTPHLIKTSRDIVNPVFIGVKFTEATPGTSTASRANLKGNFVKGTIPADENNLFLGANNTLYFPTTATEIKGMRAYFIIHDAPAGAIKRARIVEGSQVATDIELVESQEPQAKSQKMIVNGQLYIMYEGQMYNVQGLRIK